VPRRGRHLRRAPLAALSLAAAPAPPAAAARAATVGSVRDLRRPGADPRRALGHAAARLRRDDGGVRADAGPGGAGRGLDLLARRAGPSVRGPRGERTTA